MTQRFVIQSRVKFHEAPESGISRTYEEAVDDEWNLGDVHTLVASQVVPSKEFHEALLALGERYGAPPPELEQHLSALAYALIRHEPEVRAEDIGSYVTSLVQQLDDAPCTWKIVAKLHGINVDGVVKCSRMILRPVEPKDLETRRSLDNLVFRAYADDDDMHPSCICELTHRSANSGDVQAEFELYLDALRLFRRASVRYSTYRLESDAIISRGSVTSGAPRFWTTHHVARLQSGDTTLSPFINTILPALRRLHGEAQSSEKSDPLSVGLQRYRDALLHSGSPEARLTSAITSLEAVSLKGPERSELSHRLGQRVSILASIFGYHAIETYSSIIEAYDIRSTYIHGSPLPREQLAKATKLAGVATEFARIFLCVLILEPNLTKDQLINKLDNALLDSAARTKVAELLRRIPIPASGDIA